MRWGGLLVFIMDMSTMSIPGVWKLLGRKLVSCPWFECHGVKLISCPCSVFFPKLNYGVVAFGNTGMTSNAVELALRWKLIDDKLKIPAEKRFDWNKG